MTANPRPGWCENCDAMRLEEATVTARAFGPDPDAGAVVFVCPPCNAALKGHATDDAPEWARKIITARLAGGGRTP